MQQFSPIPTNTSPALSISPQQKYLLGYAKLAKYTKSQNRILDEFKNETSPNSFYQVGTLQDVSKFVRRATINSGETLPLSVIAFAQWKFNAGTKSQDRVDSINGYTLDFQYVNVGQTSIVPDGGFSIRMGSAQVNMTSGVIPEIASSINFGAFSFAFWVSASGFPQFKIRNSNQTFEVRRNSSNYEITSNDFAFNTLSLPLFNPTFIAVTYDGSTLTLYVGNQNNISSVSTSYTFPNLTQDFFIDVPYNGLKLDDILLLNTVLSQSQIDQLRYSN